MKKYYKPFIEDEEIEIEDICNASNGIGKYTPNDELTDETEDQSDWNF